MPMRDRLRMTLRAVPARLVPAVVPGGIYGGFMTVTGSAAMAAVTALVVSLFGYRGFHWKRVLDVIVEAFGSAGVIMLVIATAPVFGHWITGSGAPAQLVQFAVAQNFSTWQFLLVMNILLLVIGCFLEVGGTLLLVMPILAPVLAPLGSTRCISGSSSPITWSSARCIGRSASNLYVLATTSEAPIGEVIGGILPFLIILLLLLGLIAYWPALTLWLRNLIFGR